MGNFFSPLNPFALTPPFSFHPQSFFPSNLLFSPSTLSYLTLDPFFFTRLPLLGVLVGWLACCNASQISAAFGEKTGLCGFGCLVCWLLGGLPMQSKYRQHLGKTQFGCYPFFFTPLPLVGVLVGSACLACWLLTSLGYLLHRWRVEKKMSRVKKTR